MQSQELEEIVIKSDEAGERLDKVLAKRFENRYSRTYFQFLIKEQRISINGQLPKKKDIVNEGDEILTHFILTPEIGLTPEPIPLSIIYEDEFILVVNKVPGMVVHPAPGHWSGTFVNALLHHCQSLFSDDGKISDLRPGIVHRLDKETSGLLIAAKTNLAQQRLIEMFSSRKIHKEYLALCLGHPRDQIIHAPIGRHPIHRKLMAILEEGGREATSVCKTLSRQGKLSLVNVILVTGRTHQIRVHFKHIGAPILGDSSYGNIQINNHYGVKRQMLHAHLMRLHHPITNQLLEFRAPLPEDMQLMIDKHLKIY